MDSLIMSSCSKFLLIGDSSQFLGCFGQHKGERQIPHLATLLYSDAEGHGC